MNGDIHGSYYAGDFHNHGRFAASWTYYKVYKLTIKTVPTTPSIYFLPLIKPPSMLPRNSTTHCALQIRALKCWQR
jgi:hypothetical protein